MKEVISTKKAPAAIGPYSQAVKFGNLVFVSGQIPLDPESGTIVGEDGPSQMKQCLTNLQAILEAVEAQMDNVIKTTIFVTDLSEFAQINEVYGSFFQEKHPARSCVEVSNLPKGVKVEIEAVAVIG